MVYTHTINTVMFYLVSILDRKANIIAMDFLRALPKLVCTNNYITQHFY